MSKHSKRIEPKPGQESVWDYPRPPRLEPTGKRIRVVVDGITIAETTSALRMLETSHPPVYYLPPSEVESSYLRPESRGSFCEWKGHAHYFSIVTPQRLISNAAWSYPTPTARYCELAEYIAFYPSKIDAGYVDDVLATSQPGDFYGGWITPDIVGPFKGDVGTMGW
jgi:uncharacterized protein (DUF427 family)